MALSRLSGGAMFQGQVTCVTPPAGADGGRRGTHSGSHVLRPQLPTDTSAGPQGSLFPI